MLLKSSRPNHTFSTLTPSIPLVASSSSGALTTTRVRLSTEDISKLRFIGHLLPFTIIAATPCHRLVYLDQHGISERKLLNHCLTTYLNPTGPGLHPSRLCDLRRFNDKYTTLTISAHVHSRIDPHLLKLYGITFHPPVFPPGGSSVTLPLLTLPACFQPPLTSAELSSSLLDPRPLFVRRLKSMSCRRSCMAGEAVDWDRGVKMVEGMRGEELWGVCAHGRPTVVPGDRVV